MYIGKSFISAVITSIIWLIAAYTMFALHSQSSFLGVVAVFGVPAIAFLISYYVLRSLEKTHTRNAQSRIDRILTSLDDGELDALRDRLSGGRMGDGGPFDGEYSSLEELLMENEVKAKRR